MLLSQDHKLICQVEEDDYYYSIRESTNIFKIINIFWFLLLLLGSKKLVYTDANKIIIILINLIL